MNTGKDSKWFSHDADALDDPKIILMVSQLGMEGYGLYWMLVEFLSKQPGYILPVCLIEPLSRRYGISKEKLEAIINNYGLFEFYDNNFLSPSLMRRMDAYEKRVNINRSNALQGWKARKGEAKELPPHNNGNTTAMQSQSDPNAIREEKSREDKIREEKKKEERTVVPPSLEMVSAYCKERGNNINPQTFIDFYSSKGWLVGKARMKDWQATVRTWEGRDQSSGARASPGVPEDPVQRNIKRIEEAERLMKLNKQK